MGRLFFFMWWWWCFWSAIAACTWLAGHTILHHRIYPLLQPRLPKKKKPTPIAEDVLFKVVDDAMMGESEGEESAEWLNELASLVFTEFIGTSAALRQGHLVEHMRRVTVDTARRGWSGIFVKDAELIDWTFGEEHLPRLTNLKWHDSVDEVGVEGVLTAQLSYQGGLVTVSRIELIGGFTIYLRIALDALEGPVIYCFQGKALHYGFHHLDRLALHAQLVVEGVSWWYIDWLLSHLILPILWRRRFCFPNLRSRWLVDKPTPPLYPWDEAVQRDPNLLFKDSSQP